MFCEAGVASLGVLTSWCGWRRYRAFVRSLIEFLKQTPERERVIVRMLVAIFDSFPFEVGEVHECLVDQDEEMDDDEDVEMGNESDKMDEDVEEDSDESKRDDHMSEINPVIILFRIFWVPLPNKNIKIDSYTSEYAM